MIEANIYKALLKEWAKFGYVYSTESCVLHRLKHFEKHCCPKLKGLNVLELACNAGAFAYVICQYAASYIGVEPGSLIKEPKHPDLDYFKQLEATAKRIEHPNFTIVNQTVKQFLLSPEVDFNAFVTNFALYHFSDEEIKMIEKSVLPKCGVVCIQNRSKERKNKKNSYDFWNARNIVAWLEKSGFKCDFIWGNSEKSYSEIIGARA